MTTGNKLQEIAEFFCNLYSEELNDITGDSINEWWTINWSNWVDDKEDIEYNEIEKAVFEKIDNLKKRYQYSEDRLIKFDTYSDSSEDGSISYYQGEKGALVIEHDSDGTENAYKSGFYLTSSFQEYKEMYLD